MLEQNGKDDTARRLAEAHYAVEPGIAQIFRIQAPPELEADPDEPVKLLEINEDTVACGIMPLGFAADPAQRIDYPLILVELTPAEFEDVKSGRLALPEGWRLGEPIPRPESAVAK